MNQRVQPTNLQWVFLDIFVTGSILRRILGFASELGRIHESDGAVPVCPWNYMQRRKEAVFGSHVEYGRRGYVSCGNIFTLFSYPLFSYPLFSLFPLLLSPLLLSPLLFIPSSLIPSSLIPSSRIPSSLSPSLPSLLACSHVQCWWLEFNNIYIYTS